LKSKNLLNYFLLVIVFSTLFITIITIPITNSSIENQTLESSQPSKTKQDQNPSASAWITNGLPVCIEGNEAMLRSICSDGADGAIIAWEDNRTGNLNEAVYVQRINSDGEVLWDANGVALCIITASGEPKPVLCSDGAGGAIVAWEDYRNGNNDIYAQRVNSSGDPVWASNGMPICINDSYQNDLNIISDGVNGAIIVWTDQRLGNSDIYAQRVDSDGNIHTGWGVDGEIVCAEASATQNLHSICSDGNEGAIVAWLDVRPPYSGFDLAIYAQRIDSNGITQWIPADGLPICWTTKFNDVHMQICSDGVNGAIIAWSDNRSDNEDIYAQRVDIDGNTLWPDNGVAVCTYSSVQQFDDFAEFMCSDGNEGAIITWEDNRTDSSYDIYAQKINSTGDTQWDPNGIVISNETDSQENANIENDGRGGAYIVWEDERKGNEDIYAQYVSSSGNVEWIANGTIICNATDRQRSHQIVSDGAGGVIIAWSDDRNGFWNTDIYVSKIYGISFSPPSGGGDGDGGVKSEVFDPTMILVIGLIFVAGAISLVTARTYVVRKGGIRKDTGKIKDYIKQREEVVEDDIVLSKEKHFCLVHKGPIEGYNFICPTCNAYYCIRCVEAIKELENACWSCGKPLDPSQPIKSLEEEYDITPITEKESKLDATKGKSDNKKLKPKS